jgi:MerR family transcriptional regulator, light-induced transcriptional regulator
VATETLLRIGELSRRSGVSPELLRAWERRYGLVRPVRSPGGLRLYSLDDVERVRTMRRHLDAGVAAAEAASLATDAGSGLSNGGRAEGPRLGEERSELAAALDAFDDARAHAVFDRLLALVTVDALVADVVVPYLHDLGERWARGEVSVAQEHFASNLLRGRLLGLARGWGNGLGPLAVLACPSGEQHDLPLLMFGLVLRARGWRISYLGADTPIETVAEVAGSLDPALVVISSVAPEWLRPLRRELFAIARRHRLALAGPGADGIDVRRLEALVLTGNFVDEAERVTAAAAA